jgi:hypothetical protein
MLGERSKISVTPLKPGEPVLFSSFLNLTYATTARNQVLGLLNFGQAGLPFLILLTRIEYVVGVADLNDLGREDAVAIPRVAV